MPATTPKKFVSAIEVVNTFAQDCSNDNIKNEPMFFNSDFDFAMQNGGPITKAFLNALPYDWKKYPLVFDSRVHMLMPGWYPCIPGWHHDDIPRPNNGQPDYDNPAYYSQHILGLVNAEVCPTYFAIGKCEMPPVSVNETIYKVWTDKVDELLKFESLSLEAAKDRTLYFLDWQTFHTGTKAISNGWRWFGRVSRYTDRINHITNEIRANAQVYLEIPTQGW